MENHMLFFLLLFLTRVDEAGWRDYTDRFDLYDGYRQVETAVVLQIGFERMVVSAP